MESFTGLQSVVCLLKAQKGDKVSHKRSILDQVCVLPDGRLWIPHLVLHVWHKSPIHVYSNLLDKILSPDLQNPLLPKKTRITGYFPFLLT